MQIIVPPKILLNAEFIAALQEYLLAIAKTMDDKDKPNEALLLRYAEQICKIYADVHIHKKGQII